MKKNRVSSERVALERLKKRPNLPFPAMPDSYCGLDSYNIHEKNFKRIGFEKSVEDEFDKICRKIHREGLESLTSLKSN